ncbi:class I glutamine amidotransferase-like protein [Neurospora tetraspora]|uniref:Class I glutamine amidotransferase-like protein n=1 Tax=Neurospora tetraspora TaxID=94610 RepID=A0AAE0JNS1_9PEZI|nr:class I glutamine amidotransferase-like protein [Neurospora tetraspora]
MNNTSSATSNNRKVVRIGVFIPYGAQLLDTACIDILASMSREYFSMVGEGMVPPGIYKLAPSVEIFYISKVPPSSHPIPLTASMNILCTHHFSSPEVAPGKLDIVLVPGPDPKLDFEEDPAALSWLAGHANNTSNNETKTTDILSVCSGIYLCGAAGILKGKKACGPRGLQGDLRTRFEDQEVIWVGEELRWVGDGNLWSSGGVTNGNDLVAAYARQSRHFPGPVAELGLKFVEVDERPQRYED